MPIDKEFRQEMLGRKRQEYFSIVSNYFGDFTHDSVNDMALESKGNGHTIQLSEFERKNFK
jgi:hypothetical protein